MEPSPRRNACLPQGEARQRRRVVVTRHGSWWIWRLPGGLGLDAEENRPGAGRSRPRSGRADEERLFPSDPRSSVRGETVSGSAALLGRRSRRVGRSTFGSSAAREGPVALRPGLASGLPLSCRLWSPTGYPGSRKGQIEARDWAWKRFPAAHMCVTSMVLQRMVGVPTPR